MPLIALILLLCAGAAAQINPAEYRRRVETVTRVEGFAALWDFVKREPDGERFDAWKPPGERADLRLDLINYVRDYWGEGRAASYADLEVRPEGPFGQSVYLKPEADPAFRPLLAVPRARLRGSGVDVSGPGRSVTVVVWLKRMADSGNHAIAGIWHEGTDLRDHGTPARKVERGQRQYALFGGLAANPLAAASHISENGASTFGDKYARHLSVTPQTMPVDRWCSIALVFDNANDTVTSYLDGQAAENWVESPERHPFFRHAAAAWERGEYRPPRRFVKVEDGRLEALRVNPYWFPYDIHRPAGDSAGGPFTIGRVIHMGRNATSPGLIGGVAVYGRALTAGELRRLHSLTPR